MDTDKSFYANCTNYREFTGIGDYSRNSRQAFSASVFICVYPWLSSSNKNAPDLRSEACAFISSGDERLNRRCRSAFQSKLGEILAVCASDGKLILPAGLQEPSTCPRHSPHRHARVSPQRVFGFPHPALRATLSHPMGERNLPLGNGRHHKLRRFQCGGGGDPS
jgi:hypothetical protein